MDRLEGPPSSKQARFRLLGILIFVLLLFGVLTAKALEDGWFLPRKPVELDHQPAFLFFNRHKGCDCVLEVYELADSEIRTWPEEDRSGARVIKIDLDDQPQLGPEYKIVRAPTLLLLDASSREVHRQEVAISETQVFDLEKAANAFQMLMDP
jgi:hypothetical protein